MTCPIINAYVGEVRILESSSVKLGTPFAKERAGEFYDFTDLYMEETEQWREIEGSLDLASGEASIVRLRAFYCIDVLRQLACEDMLKTGSVVFQHAAEYFRPIPYSWSGLGEVLDFIEACKRDAISYRFEQSALRTDRQFTEFSLAKVSALDALGAMVKILRPELRDPLKHINLVGVQFAHGLRSMNATLSTYIVHCRRLLSVTPEHIGVVWNQTTTSQG